MALGLALVITSAVLWSTVWVANDYLLASTEVVPGINLVFLPAGFRLLIVIVFGIWGAIGIFLADPLMFLIAYGRGSPVEVLTSALIAGFAPYLTVKAFCRIAGIGNSLLQLKPIHLPLLALAVSVVTPLLFNLSFLAQHREAPRDFLHNLTAMMTGDFLGCLIVSVLARVGLGAARAIAGRAG